eukprot:TRINITY_DN9910_c0_g1_i1.p1 TRINITY_DN9910_c0_g1~~TRINITY_DN9910_c0_g1_i1.p1  ORF type:complete len:211 (-),score=26.29 TRINITY_DN9910_c0_g1_i1:67-639(-)
MEDDARIEKEVRLCEERVQAVVDDPAIQILMKNMNERGCGMNLKNFICKPCESTTIQGGYQLKPDGQAQVVLCSNHLRDNQRTRDTLVHELVHAFDACRAEIDLTNCVHHACTEIRAANLSGDCRFSREFYNFMYQQKYNFPIYKQQQSCVKRRAILSLQNDYCRAVAEDSVEKAFPSCYYDHAPFSKPP